MRVNHPEPKANGSPARAPAPESAINSRVMLTTIELFDRVAEIECATTLKDHRRRVPTEFDGVGVGLAHWAATYGPWASWRILCVACKALLTPVWAPRARRPRTGWLMRQWVRYSDARQRRRAQLARSKPTRLSSARNAS